MAMFVSPKALYPLISPAWIDVPFEHLHLADTITVNAESDKFWMGTHSSLVQSLGGRENFIFVSSFLYHCSTRNFGELVKNNPSARSNKAAEVLEVRNFWWS
jgi:hypothetical protein